jgi:ribonuclease VapC
MPSGDFVLDASALLCLIFQEPGADRVEACLPGARMGAANLAEVIGKLIDLGFDGEAVAQELAELDLEIVPLDSRQAETAGYLRATTRGLGLSLGDRCCLALTEMLDATALTTDRAWTGVPKHIAVEVVR